MIKILIFRKINKFLKIKLNIFLLSSIVVETNGFYLSSTMYIHCIRANFIPISVENVHKQTAECFAFDSTKKLYKQTAFITFTSEIGSNWPDYQFIHFKLQCLVYNSQCHQVSY